MIVADNNVISGFVLPKDDFHAEAVSVRKKDPDWHAPALFRSEFRSVARKHLLKGESEDLLIQAAQAAKMTGHSREVGFWLVADSLGSKSSFGNHSRHIIGHELSRDEYFGCD